MKIQDEVITESVLWQPVFSFFKDEVKTFLWFVTTNPLLGGCRPIDMILMGREKKLSDFIKNCVDGNLP